ncbi:MAG: preprotein translocase subunit SecE [Candidatus Taylorbacteria bacterium RIFCSPLOWO2_12_FULL_43_20]|uniref:Protein translocase subunit SecE n=1 Tax=Candidatus Taylorbacteria bacterium RIFCSPLOWO2_12_FULL_43_20 TaxID=1802332 RepID=A0A1G2P1F3_9BACT|nr:MAG: preprotein translocase subunit SecE [Candidatus Taylorbacteria bacterium RIFCSPHIGHO2_01_FULL_43_120]OHA22190.1 MAG: preprotein translocase subunit SecE [Candidatus Taylorbacteria bacterium RIFCSPHIGHO2_02_FULL_43_55]OHA28040.1 MAG: preprotein translocase subunit SecE [Candidatus Taylorbacteria bacterium RIFCSPHIGHO2_12_FULL_42_34]OHA32273.1 MAG: preprotein translocase subunit SecE [Candidatus Taylorbacteria bacterium RIFCSPLOWO2_01_FULL_43_83]OHA37866.1 MAG: preprotein translocase subu
MKIVDYVRETRVEMKHVSWPTKRQAAIYTALVIVISIVIGALLGFFDYVFAFILGVVI